MKKKLLSALLILIMLISSIPLLPIVAKAEETNAAADVTLDDIVAAAASVVRENEGSYSSVNADDNGALSIGWIQWHANRALSLLRTIVAANDASARELLGEELYNEIATTSSWSTRILTKDETSRISKLISTEEGKKAQDDLAAKDLSAYINRAIGYGIKDPAALVYYADIENQCGSGGAKRVAAAAATLAGSYEEVTLEHIYEAALADSIAGKYTTRRQKTYNNCLLLEWEIVNTEYEVWNLLSARNVRAEADTNSTLITTIAKGAKVIIMEKAANGTQTRGRTSMGWITIDDGSCELNTLLTGKAVPAPVIFDVAGGSFGSSPKVKVLADGINAQRVQNTLIVYNCESGLEATPTNAYGTEVAVSADGIALNSPVYGKNKTAIPEGGFVLSGVGNMYTWLMTNVKAGNYVIFDRGSMSIIVHESYESFIGIPAGSSAVDSVNSQRLTDQLVVYDGDYEHKTAQTNAYGTEVAVDSTGKVLSSPVYGACKTEIPEGGFVLSGIGKSYTWMMKTVSAGDYIYFDRETKEVTVYNSESLYLSCHKESLSDTPFGLLPAPIKEGYTFAGWFDGDAEAPILPDTVCNTPFCVFLTARWEKTAGVSISFDPAGGVISGTANSEINGFNCTRPADSLIIYDEGTAANTNAYGTEVAVDSTGITLNDPVYGLCKTEIPEGGFVLSGIGKGYTWMMENIKKGMRITFDSTTQAVTVYKTDEIYDLCHLSRLPGEPTGKLPTAEKPYYRFLGWFTPQGKQVDENTVVPAGGMKLYAKWEVIPGKLSFNTDGGTLLGLASSASLSGTNIQRLNNTLVLYKDKSSTGTNKYGCEALIDPNGTVVAIYPYGSSNNPIPEGCCVLSGVGSMYSWIQTSLKLGSYVEIKDGTVNVWTDKKSAEASKITHVTYEKTYGDLPAAKREGYVFLGWQDPDGNTVTKDSKVEHLGDITLKANWEKLITVAFKADGGKLLSAAPTATAAGINVQRLNNTIVIYAGKTSTGTNKYGSEAVIGADGTVLAVYPYGTGNSNIPEGCYVISAIGTMHTWLQENLKVGKHVVLSEYNIRVYDSPASCDAEKGVMYVKASAPLGALPSASMEGKAFGGWYFDGKLFTKESSVTSDTVLFAKWTATSAKLAFNTNGGTFAPAKGSFTVGGLNVLRPNNTLVIYDGSFTHTNSNTNKYGAEAAVDASGKVISAPAYGTCKTEIPEGGFVLSGIGTAYTWLSQNVKVGNYVYFDRETMTVTVYESYDDRLASIGKTIHVGKLYGDLPTPKKDGYVFCGWVDWQGEAVTADTVVTSCEVPVLSATWKKIITLTYDAQGGEFSSGEATLAGTNIQRLLNCLVLYKDLPSTNTNIYGTEALINSEGQVVRLFGYGKGNNSLQSGYYILSGNGTMSAWVGSNLTVGSYVRISGNTVKVYKTHADMIADSGPISFDEGKAIGTLPTPRRTGYTFEGWYAGSTKVTESFTLTDSTTVTARWSAKTIPLSFDTNGGAFAPVVSRTAEGRNTLRLLNNIIIFDGADGKTSTGTNKHGVEVLVSAEGRVIEVQPYGNGNASIPKGGYVISGNGTAEQWLKDNLSVGDIVVTDGLTFSIYKGDAHYIAYHQKSVVFDTAFGILPIPQKEGAVFDGWYTPAGVKVTAESILKEDSSPLKLTAKWK